MIIALQYSLKSGNLIPPGPFFFSQIALAIQCLLCVLNKFWLFVVVVLIL